MNISKTALVLREKIESLANGTDIDKATILEMELKKARRAGKIKLLGSFMVGSTVGGTVVGYVAYRIFKSLLGGFLGL